MRALGVRGSSPIDLMAVGFARSSADADTAEPMARRILTRYRTMQAFGEASPSEISSFTGLDGFELMRALALMELGRRTAQAGKGPIEEIRGSDDVSILLDYLRGEKREHFVAIMLDAKNHILRIATIHIGTVDTTLVGAREVFREAIREGACSIVVAHNHPSGDSTPSPEDLRITSQLAHVGQILDIPLHDHVIIGRRGYYGIREKHPEVFR